MHGGQKKPDQSSFSFGTIDGKYINSGCNIIKQGTQNQTFRKDFKIFSHI